MADSVTPPESSASPFANGGLRGIYANTPHLAGLPVALIHADLTAGDGEKSMDLTVAKPLTENVGVSFEGTKKYGDFDIPGEQARQWLSLPNPHGCSNFEVLKPWANGMDIARRLSDTWIIDFGTTMIEADAALYETPFQHVIERVKPVRKDVKWWLHERPRPNMRSAISGLHRFIVTPRVAKHRLFAWLNASVLPDTRLNIIARSDDTTFGLLNSRMHELWSLATCSWHGVGNDPTYNAKSCFETFPFPAGLTPADTAPVDTVSGSPFIAPGDRLLTPKVL